ncbi:hypothetical protein NC651_037321 [Populus alba x Populus x berolinensis]|nr:hypothetical protein NC651_037321 [Populus alba x Populus x berolinensis]
MAMVSLCTLMHIKHSKNDIPHKRNVPLIDWMRLLGNASRPMIVCLNLVGKWVFRPFIKLITLH